MSASTTIHSNAFNFKSYVQHGVDPRTGQYTVSLALPELKSHALAGPVLPLTISFSPMNTADVGFGLGWGISLTEYRLGKHLLSLGSGETFKVTGSGPTPDIAEKKLDSFHFHKEGERAYRVVHRSGLVELLEEDGSSEEPVARPVKILGPDGRTVSLDYTRFVNGERLASVSDDSGELLRVTREGHEQVELLFYPGHGPGGEPMAHFVLHLDAKRRVTRVVLPTQEQACWELTYKTINDCECLTEVRTPTGAHETIHYDGGHEFPGGGRPTLPRVARHEVDPRHGQPLSTVSYDYGDHNFLGLGALSDWKNDDRDNLYRTADASFFYGSTASLMVGSSVRRKVVRKYNRFHLLVEEETTQGDCLKRVSTTYYADLPENVNRTFDDQPPQCQLPVEVKTGWYLVGDATRSRVEVTKTLYDTHGNLTERTNPDLTREVMEYYPAEGVPGHCPPDPEGFVRSLRARTAHPAPGRPGNAPTLRTAYDYIALQPRPGPHAREFLVEQQQTVFDAAQRELKRIFTEHHDDPADALQLGRPRSISETVNGKPRFTDYAYSIGTSAATRLLEGEGMLQIVETLRGFDKTSRSITRQESLHRGLPLRVEGPDGVDMHFRYDALNRVVREVVAPDSDFQAVRRYAYHLLGESDDGQAWQRMTDAKQVQTLTWLDGLARVIHEERQDADGAATRGQPPEDAPFRTIYRAQYDALDQRVVETVVDWLDTQDLELSTTYVYDDWGERYRTTRPDGVCEVTEMSPFGVNGPVERRWLESTDTPAVISQRTRTQLNRFNKADTVERMLDDTTTLHTLEDIYDGLGQCVESHEKFDSLARVTRFEYDVWRRVVATTRPDGTRIRHEFADHSTEALPTALKVKPAKADAPEVTVGTQTYDGINRLVGRTVGGRVEVFHYDDGKLQVKQRVTPAGNEIDYTYQPLLGEAPHTIVSPGDEATYDYDPQSGAITLTTNTQGKRAYSYALTGELASESWTGLDGATHASTHGLSRMGRQLERHDTGTEGAGYDVTTTTRYDRHGRLHWTAQGLLRADLTYDRFGRTFSTTTQNFLGGLALVKEQEYDSLGREHLRTLKVDGQTFRIEQEWRADNQLTRRHLTLEGRTLLDEVFTYDLNGRLQTHACSGEQLPQDPHGNAIKHQAFVYDALDNITSCITQFVEGPLDRAVFTLSDTDPCQLKSATHTHASYADAEFEYDADGNLRNDEAGRALRYDALGRLLAATLASGEATYHYDGHSELASWQDADGARRVRMYQGFQLNHEVRAGQATHLLYAGDQPVGQQVADDVDQARLLLTTAIGSVIGEIRAEAATAAAYSAHGDTAHVLACLLGYNGEQREATGGYLLGRGYRVYSPRLMRFNSPDSMSPFGEGGINPYVYCQGNPVMFRDPTGHYRESPDYIYPEPPVEQSGGGGWMKWLGVAIAGVFLAVSVVGALYAATAITTAVVIGIAKSAAWQVAGIGLSVVGTVSNDPTIQQIAMFGSMALSGVGMMGMMGAKGAKTAVDAIDDVIPPPVPAKAPLSIQSRASIPTSGGPAPAPSAPYTPPTWTQTTAPRQYLPRIGKQDRFVLEKHADRFSDEAPLLQRGARPSPTLRGWDRTEIKDTRMY